MDFKNTVIIMTTNLGTRDISKGVSVGFGTAGQSRGSYDRMKSRVQEELKQHFRPEFLNRVDDIIVFHQLSQEEIFRIVDLMITKVDERLKDRDMGIELRPAGNLGTDHAGAVARAGHQVRRAVLARAGSAQGLAVHREHRRRLPACQPGRDPGSDDHVQRQRVHRGQHPPDSDQARDRAR